MVCETKNIEETKGWKYYKRWEDFNNKRAFANGDLPNAKTYFNEVNKIQQTDFNKLEGDNYSWVPVGVMTEAPSLYDWKETGIGRINCIAFRIQFTS